MDLDDLERFKQLDTLNMLAEIESLPDQLAAAWKLGQGLPLPQTANVARVVISGMGGSAIGADLLAAAVASTCSLPVIIHRDYALPAFATGAETLVVVSSPSCDTETTLDALNTTRQ